jgi:hypothetical protein
MTTEWVVTAAAERFDLNSLNQGENTFTVTNPGPAADRVVVEVVPGDGADRDWFVVEEPQRRLAGGASASFLIRTAVPLTATPGERWLQVRAYSASVAPEESSRLSGRVAFTIKPRPVKKVWWPYAVAALLVLIVLVTLGALLLGGGGPPDPVPSTTPSPSPSASATPGPKPTRVLPSLKLTLNPNRCPPLCIIQPPVIKNPVNPGG